MGAYGESGPLRITPGRPIKTTISAIGKGAESAMLRWGATLPGGGYCSAVCVEKERKEAFCPPDVEKV